MQDPDPPRRAHEASRFERGRLARLLYDNAWSVGGAAVAGGRRPEFRASPADTRDARPTARVLTANPQSREQLRIDVSRAEVDPTVGSAR